MKKSCDRNQTKYNSRRRLWLLILSRTGIAIGALSVVAVAFSSWWLWNFVNQQLAPLVEKNLTQTLKRPVSLGKVENFSLLSLQFGASSIPATTTDPDRISVAGVEVTFDPLQLLFNRTLKLDVTLVNPNVYIEQDQQGNWISTTIGSQEGSGPLKTELNKIRVRNADVVLVPNINRDQRSAVKDQNLAGFQPTPNKSRVAFAQVNGFGQFLENNELIRYDLNGNSVTGGTLDLTGESRFKTQASNLQIQAQNLLASDITRIVELPLELRSGRVDGNLNIQLRQNLAPVLLGTANLKAVTVAFPQVPQPFFNSHGILSFQGTQIRLDNVQTSYGKIPGIVSGVVDTTSGYNIAARIPAVSVPDAQKTLNLQFPVPVAGELKADVQLTGPILKPILSGSVVNTKPGRVDRVKFSNIRTQFTYSTADAVVRFKDIQATPTVGGEITGAGTINLEQPKLAFDGVARNIPGDAIARVYGASPQVKIGTVSAKVNISGSPTKPKTVVNWQAAGATYPASGQVIVTNPQNWLFRNTVFNVANGTVRGSGQLINNRWQAKLQATNVQLGQLTQVPLALQVPVSGTFNVSGTTASFQPETIRATGLGRLNVAGGTVTATNIQLNQGRWQTQLQADNVQLKQILPEIPPQYQGLLTGRFNVSGTTASFQPETIRATGLGRLNVAGGTVTATNIQLNQGRWQTQLQANNVQLKQILPEIPPQYQGLLSGRFNVSARRGCAIKPSPCEKRTPPVA